MKRKGNNNEIVQIFGCDRQTYCKWLLVLELHERKLYEHTLGLIMVYACVLGVCYVNI